MFCYLKKFFTFLISWIQEYFSQNWSQQFMVTGMGVSVNVISHLNCSWDCGPNTEPANGILEHLWNSTAHCPEVWLPVKGLSEKGKRLFKSYTDLE